MFRPCIDLHEGKVKQIVGGTLGATEHLRTNFVSEKSSAWFADLYRRDNLRGGHVIMLGAGNDDVARAALAAYPGGLHVGGGINAQNANDWLDAGASHVIVTSWVFREGRVDWLRLDELVKKIGKEKLVLDLSCRKVSSPKSPVSSQAAHADDSGPETRDSGLTKYFVVTDRWQKFTDLEVNAETLQKFSQHCAEFLIHAVDVEGLCRGIDTELVQKLGTWTPIPTTYAGGANSLADLELVTKLGSGEIDLTIGSALDIFGGTGVRYEECVAFNRRQK